MQNRFVARESADVGSLEFCLEAKTRRAARKIVHSTDGRAEATLGEVNWYDDELCCEGACVFDARIGDRVKTLAIFEVCPDPDLPALTM